MKQSARLQIRCEEAWYLRLAAQAQQSGMTVSEYVRTCIALGSDQYQKKLRIERGKPK